MVVPFGIGIGDFFAMLKLGNDVCRSLSTTKEAAADYNAFYASLNSLQSSRRFVFGVLMSSNEHDVDQAVLNGLDFQFRQCKHSLEEFAKLSEKYTQSFSEAGSGSKMRDTRRKVSWAMSHAEMAKKMQADLESHLTAFMIYADALAQ